MWHTHELSELEQEALRGLGQGLERWETALTKRFKEPRTISLQKLMTEKYTTQDAKARREPAAYVQTILGYARSAGMESVQT